MKTETVIQILESLMAECTRRFTPEEKTLKIRTWTNKLKDLTDEQGHAGLDKALDTIGEFMPTIGAFKQLCLSGKGFKTIEDEAINAWATALQTIQRAGHWNSPVFKDSCIAEAIRKTGGWKQFCNMSVEDKDRSFRKRDFIDYYIVAKRQGKDFSPVLHGQYKDYKFIGYAEGEIKQVISQIRRAEDLERSISNTISSNIKALNQAKG